MKFTLTKGNQSSHNLLRQSGYAFNRTRQGKDSFIRRLRGSEFPRFHLYINSETNAEIECALHLDQRAPVYSGSKAHGGDYDSSEVEEEVDRLRSQ